MFFEVTRVIDAVERISRKTGNLFRDDQIEIALFGAGDHALEFTALFGVGAGDAFVRENLVKLPIGVALNILPEIPLLALKGICLIFVVGGNAAIGSHTLSHIDYFSLLIHAFISIHINPPFTVNVSVPIIIESENRFVECANLFLQFVSDGFPSSSLEVVNFLDHIRECCWQLNIRVKIGEIFFHNECFCFMVLRI